MTKLKSVIYWLFAVLLFLVPIILWPFSFELFEFNKMVLVYALTTTITAVWLTRCVINKKFIFRRTILDIPLLVFLGSQIISTIISIDPSTSLFGYYSRFNGGLLSIISYLLLYWAFVSNITKDEVIKLIKVTFISATVVSIYGVAEHFGIDKNLWQQDVQSRVFSTLGQPNWLAAWLVALLPLTWVFILEYGKKETPKKKIVSLYLLSLLLFITLLFTKSRSGLLGLAFAFLAFWGGYLWTVRSKIKSSVSIFGIVAAFYLITAIVFGTELTPSINTIFGVSPSKQEATQTTGTVLETGGTDSGSIREIVWKGAVDIWKHYPVFGTGVETYAFSYYLFRPAAHNLTSEWDFIYNKAHNEYLNFAANSGTVGILSYLVLIGFAIYQIFKKEDGENKEKYKYLSLGIFSGYLSILVTNFFGFSVVPVQILFYLFPAMIVARSNEKDPDSLDKFDTSQKIAIGGIGIIAFIVLWKIAGYWVADSYYAKSSRYNTLGRYDLVPQYITKAIEIEPKQSLFYAELAKAYTNLAAAYNGAKEATTASKLAEAAIGNYNTAVNLSPANINLKRMEFGSFIVLSTMDPNYILEARDVLEVAIMQAPTDAKIFYNLGLVYSRLGEDEKALETLKKTVEMRSNYKEARLAYAILLIDKGETAEAKSQLEYILTNIDPQDSLSKQYLETIK